METAVLGVEQHKQQSRVKFMILLCWGLEKLCPSHCSAWLWLLPWLFILPCIHLTPAAVGFGLEETLKISHYSLP